jgi:hypothetical protein
MILEFNDKNNFHGGCRHLPSIDGQEEAVASGRSVPQMKLNPAATAVVIQQYLPFCITNISTSFVVSLKIWFSIFACIFCVFSFSPFTGTCFLKILVSL